MKQHISPAQLQALTDEQRERLRGWWIVQEGDRFFAKGKWEDIAGESAPGCVESFDYYGLSCNKEDCLPLLSVGQCIQLLGAKLLHINHYHKQWQVSFLREQKEEELFITELYADDLIDALWQAVKEVL